MPSRTVLAVSVNLSDSTATLITRKTVRVSSA